MFKIFENGTEIGVADKLTFIKKADNGCFVLCAEDEAQGIAFNGETFTLGTNGGIENSRDRSSEGAGCQRHHLRYDG